MKQKAPPLASQGSRSLAKGLQILELLAAAHEPMTLTTISRGAGLGKVSTLRLLRTLQASGHAVRDDNDAYRVEGDWPTSQGQVLQRAVREAAAPVMRKLSEQFGESVALAFLFDDHIRVLEVIESTQHIRMSNMPGRILQPYASSLGKAIAAYQSPERITRLLDTYGIYPLTSTTITSPHAIQQELAVVREQGCAWDRQETVEGGQCIGAPIRAGGEGVVAALSISMPKLRFTEELEEQLPDVLRAAALAVEKALVHALEGDRSATTAKRRPAESATPRRTRSTTDAPAQ